MGRTSTAAAQDAEPGLEPIDIRHRPGCPKVREVTDPHGKVSEVTALETWVADRPLRQGGGQLLVTRCIECGNQEEELYRTEAEMQRTGRTRQAEELEDDED